MPLVNLVKGELTGVANYVWDTDLLDWVRSTTSPTVSGEVSVSNFPATQTINASSLPLPTGAATAANQILEIAELEVLTQTLGGAEASRVDEASASVTYVGKAVAGTADATAAWKISRITTSGSVIITEFADGNTNYDNVWSNRASLSYS